MFLSNAQPSRSFLNSLRDTTVFLGSLKDDVTNIILSALEKVSYANQYTELYNKNNIEEIDKIKDQLNSITENNLRKILAKFVLPFYGIIALLLLLIPYVYKKIFNEEKANYVLLKIFEQNLLLKIFAVFILTASILILGIGGIIEENVLGTLLGGISVYVLQSSLGKKNGENGDATEE
jgi:hypothetical protein